MNMGRGFQGALLKVFKARDFQLKVLQVEEINENYLRFRVDLGGLLEFQNPFPTLWVRCWFPI